MVVKVHFLNKVNLALSECVIFKEAKQNQNGEIRGFLQPGDECMVLAFLESKGLA